KWRAVGCFGLKSWPRANTAHLPLDQPLELVTPISVENLEFDARGAGIDDEDRVHRRSCRRQRGRAATRIGVKHCRRAGGHARAHGGGARGQDDRPARAEHDPGRVRLGEEREVLGQHVAGFEIGDDENLRTPCDRGFNALDLRRFGIDRIVESKRPVESATRYLPTFGHLAQRGCVDGRRDLGRHHFDGGENRNARRARPTWVNRSIAFCTMSRFASRSGKMLMAASVMKSVSEYVGTSKMKTWLMRRAVRRPVLLEVTSRMSSSVCRLPFISSSPLDWWINSTAFAAAASLWGTSTISKRPISRRCSRATAAIFAAGPTRMGTMIPACAASMGPRSAVSSQG